LSQPAGSFLVLAAYWPLGTPEFCSVPVAPPVVPVPVVVDVLPVPVAAPPSVGTASVPVVAGVWFVVLFCVP
jgi:hypothetical protein